MDMSECQDDAISIFKKIEEGLVLEQDACGGDSVGKETRDDSRDVESADDSTDEESADDSTDEESADDSTDKESADDSTDEESAVVSRDVESADDSRYEESADDSTDKESADDSRDEESADNETADKESGDNVRSSPLKKRYRPGRRISRTCPLCSHRLKYLSQHLQRQHKLTTALKRHQVLGKARKKEPIYHVNRTSDRRRWTYACPIKDCPSRGLKRPDVHIRTQHNIKLKSSQYKRLMQKISHMRKKKREQRRGHRKQRNMSSASSKGCAALSSDDVIKGFQDYTEALKGCNESAKASARAKSRTLQLLCSSIGVTLSELIKPCMPQRIVESLTRDGKMPKTINKYLLVLKQFCHYLTVYSPMARVIHCSNTTLVKTVTVTEDFIAATRTGINRRQAELKAQINDIIIDARAIREFNLNSESELSGLCEPANRMTWPRIMRLRNLMMMKIILSQAPRTGVITNATLGEFMNSRRTVHPETFEEVHTFLVSRHKTSQKGPATVVLSHELEQQLMFYVKNARHLSAGCDGIDIKSSGTPLFLAANGKPVYKLSQVVQRTWTSMGLSGKFSATIVRKTAATKAVSSLTRHQADNVAQLMSHSTDTQQQYYVAAQEEREKIRACSMLSTVLCQDDDDSANVARSSEIREHVDDKSVEEPTASSSPMEVEMAPVDPAEEECSSFSLLRFYGQLKKYGKKYTPQQEHVMLSTYERVKKMEPRATIVRAAQVASEHILLKMFNIKQISDKIRHMLDLCHKKECLVTARKLSDRAKISKLSKEDIATLLPYSYLAEILKGERKCERHSCYKLGGIARRNLVLRALKGPFTDRQEEEMMEELVRRFCKNDTALLDYVQKVLLPEALIKVTQEVLDLPYDQAVLLFNST